MEPRILRDLTVLRPEPRGVIVFGDPPVRYPIMSVVDMTYQAVVRLFELDAETTADGNMMKHFDRLGEQVALLCPSMPPEVVAGMSYRQRKDFYDGALESTPASVAEALSRVLTLRPPPADDAADDESVALRELWAIKERLAARPLPQPPPTAA